MNLPKVLIIGSQFNKNTGGGITLTNLFSGWDRDKIAFATERVDTTDLTICENYYQLGYDESKRRFPFNLIEKKFKSGVLNTQILNNQTNVNTIIPNSKKQPQVAKIYDAMLHFTGLYHYSRNLKITTNLLNWIDEFKPDLIYCLLGSLELIQFITKLHDKLNLPVAIHIMDDWPTTISKPGLFQVYWKHLIDKKFRLLLDKTSIFLSISEAMSEEYKRRYNIDFIPFHNPIETDIWCHIAKQEYAIGTNIKLLYTGRIGLGINISLKQIAKAINEIRNTDLWDINFIIQTPDAPDWIKEFNFIETRFISDYSLYPQSLTEADILILPYDFAGKSAKFIKYSMPTKASEYMISGTPVLLYSSKETAMCQHALKHKWAYIVSEENPVILIDAIKEMVTNEKLRKDIGTKAKEFSLQHFNAEVVRENFRLALTSA
jgi:glycosyltransferase involved in cell wall biosynthesis